MNDRTVNFDGLVLAARSYADGVRVETASEEKTITRYPARAYVRNKRFNNTILLLSKARAYAVSLKQYNNTTSYYAVVPVSCCYDNSYERSGTMTLRRTTFAFFKNRLRLKTRRRVVHLYVVPRRKERRVSWRRVHERTIIIIVFSKR